MSHNTASPDKVSLFFTLFAWIVAILSRLLNRDLNLILSTGQPRLCAIEQYDKVSLKDLIVDFGQQDPTGLYALEELRRSGSCCVYKAKMGAKTVCIKAIPLSDLKTNGRLVNEIKALALLNHPNLLHLISAYKISAKGELWLITDHYEHGDLFTFLNVHGHSVDHRTLLGLLKQVLRGLAHLHSLNMAHRDVKTENIFVGRGRACLGDLGFVSPPGKDKQRFSVPMGTPMYIAPELAAMTLDVNGHLTFGEKVDIWAMGVVMVEVLIDDCPVYGDEEDPMELFNKILAGHAVCPDTCLDRLPIEVAEAIRKCLRYEEKERVTACELLEQACFKTKAASDAEVERALHGLDN